MSIGDVFLVGAGPGDPDLITVKGMKCLQQADVVVYDRLANRALLDYAPHWAEFIYVGKEPKRHRLQQSEINQLLVDLALRGQTVVRLKGGDPFVFGRGGEEAQVLLNAGIRFEIIPGISSALAVPAYAGIPVTQRHMAQSFTVVTGHTASEEDTHGTNWSDLPKSGTLVVLMGVRHFSKIAATLIENGRSAQTPAAIIRWGTTPEQEIITGTLADLPQKAKHIAPPAIIVIGDVVTLHDELNWFSAQSKPSPLYDIAESLFTHSIVNEQEPILTH